MDDGRHFVQEFRTPIIKSAAQIYISALPFYARSSMLSQTFLSRYDGVANVRLGASETRTQCVATLEGPPYTTCAVAFSSDGNYVASGSLDGTLCIWDFKTNSNVREPWSIPRSLSSMTSVAFSSNGTLLTSGGYEHLCIWETKTGDLLFTFNVPTPMFSRTVAFSNDDTMVFYGGLDNTVDGFTIFSVVIPSDPSQIGHQSLEKVHQWKWPNLGDGKPSMILSLSTHQVAGAVWPREAIQIYDILTDAAILPTLNFPPEYAMETIFRRVELLAFSPDGNRIVARFLDIAVYVWDVQSGTLIHKLYTTFCRTAALSPNGSHIVFAGLFDKVLRIWDLGRENTHSAMPARHEQATIHSIAFSPDGSKFAFVQHGELLAWDTNTGSIISSVTLQDTTASKFVSFSPEGRRVIAVLKGIIYIWNLGNTIITIPLADSPFRDPFKPEILEVSCTRNYIVVYSDYIHIWDWNTCILNTITTNPIEGGPLHSRFLAPSPDGRKIVVASTRHFINDKIYVIDASSGVCMHTIGLQEDHSGILYACASFSPDGSRIYGSAGTGRLSWWDSLTGALGNTTMAHSNAILSLMFSNEGTRIISRSCKEQVVLDAQTLLPVQAAEISEPRSSIHLLDDGWVVDLLGTHLFWVPVDNRTKLEQCATFGSQMLLGGEKLTWIDISGLP